MLSVAKRALVERWTLDYSFLRANAVGWYLAPRGVVVALERSAGLRVAGTGSLALRRYLSKEELPVTALAQVVLYADDVDDAARALGLKETARATANVILASPYDPRLLDLARPLDREAPVVGAGQAVADLLTLPGRGREEAVQLMDALAATDPAWR